MPNALPINSLSNWRPKLTNRENRYTHVYESCALCPSHYMVHIKMRQSMLYNVKSLKEMLVTLIGFFLITGTYGFLLYPASTVLQLTPSMSVPIDIGSDRKVFIDLGFQMNYNLPFDLASFYNPAIWSNAWERRGKRNLDSLPSTPKMLLAAESGVHPNDFTAGELYAGVERMLEDYGYHRSCLLLSVCELALHPLHNNDNYSYSMMEQAITLMLTPSQHEGFGQNEKLYKHRYERAESLGFLGGNCQKAYPKCEVDFLNLITRIVR